eukprot:Lithocolla_globosa_v1_NODE_2074_length_2179_cov_54.294727.p4 type:complete len:101 gc:universal NODE_2074_length_2179_cov_54.294727:389-87(-)
MAISLTKKPRKKSKRLFLKPKRSRMAMTWNPSMPRRTPSTRPVSRSAKQFTVNNLETPSRRMTAPWMPNIPKRKTKKRKMKKRRMTRMRRRTNKLLRKQT